MKTNKLLFLLLMAVATVLSSCKKDKKIEAFPTVVTNGPTDVTTTSTSLSGKITDDGNAAVTEAGFVYSNLVAEPTTADDKVQVTDFNTFTVELTGLASGKTYRVRAYAINNKGTGYGELRTFETGNQGPVASNVQITGDLQVNKGVIATYTYIDAELDAEAGTTYQWYVANNAAGAGEVAIVGATAKTFVIQEAQNAKYLRVAVTPKSNTGTLTGVATNSSFMGAVGEATTVTFTYNGQQVTYGIITSAKTQKKWLDRNLGAGRLAQSIDDYHAYGDLFQWGRLADGHQLITRTAGTDAGSIGVNGISSPNETSTGDSPSTNKFIIRPGVNNGDWRSTPNNNLWQGVNGINNPCPAGWRIPTREEWVAEGITGVDAFSKLKLPYTGRRDSQNSSFSLSDLAGIYWTSTRLLEPDYFGGPLGAAFFAFADGLVDAEGFDARANGDACRCIKE